MNETNLYEINILLQMISGLILRPCWLQQTNKKIIIITQLTGYVLKLNPLFRTIYSIMSYRCNDGFLIKSVRDYSPVILREPQQRRPLCVVGWVRFSSENVNHAEIVPGQKESKIQWSMMSSKSEQRKNTFPKLKNRDCVSSDPKS